MCAGRRYGELVTRLIDTEDCSSILYPDFDPASATRVATMLPLGLYRRSHTLHYSNSPCNYVFTNPPPNTLIQSGDKIFVIIVFKNKPGIKMTRSASMWRNAKVGIKAAGGSNVRLITASSQRSQPQSNDGPASAQI